jgi:biotin-dependent carboxylase-like uncharacterized protein
MTHLEVIAPGPLTTVQDLGRPGYAAVGVPESGALDQAALRLANRLVGNPESAAGLEATFGGLDVRAHGPVHLACTGAPAELRLDGAPAPFGASIRVSDGSRLGLGVPPTGVRTVLAVRGGIAAPALVGSASTDLLSGLGAPLVSGQLLDVGPAPDLPVPPIGPAPLGAPASGDVAVRVMLGPRDSWFTPASVQALCGHPWVVASDSNRIGLRLRGPGLRRRHDRELPTEGTVAGSVQVPADGQPVLFLRDHPVTGGYPVIAVVVSGDLPLLAQVRAGQRLRFRVRATPRWLVEFLNPHIVDDSP